MKPSFDSTSWLLASLSPERIDLCCLGGNQRIPEESREQLVGLCPSQSTTKSTAADTATARSNRYLTRSSLQQQHKPQQQPAVQPEVGRQYIIFVVRSFVSALRVCYITVCRYLFSNELSSLHHHLTKQLELNRVQTLAAVHTRTLCCQVGSFSSSPVSYPRDDRS